MAVSIIGVIPSPSGGNIYLATGTVAGPASYSAGGFTVDTGLATVLDYQIYPDVSQLIETNDYTFSSHYSESSGTITILVYLQQISATQTWGEASSGDYSGVTWHVAAWGY